MQVPCRCGPSPGVDHAAVSTTADAFGREDGFTGGSQTLPQGAKALDHRDSRELKWPRDWGNHGARAAIEVWVFGGGTAAEKNRCVRYPNNTPRPPKSRAAFW